MPDAGFAGLRVLTLESRRAQEMAKLISNCGGQPMVAPSMREVPLESNTDALAFAAKLMEGGLDLVIFLTGVGTRALARVVETVYPRDRFVAALNQVTIVARGPKPVAALRELGVQTILAVPEPNTWREILRVLDEGPQATPLKGCSVAIQEYGEANPELVAGLTERGASVTSIHVYDWMLPADTGPLREAITALTRGEVDVILLTSSIQVRHLLQVAAEMGMCDQVRRAFARILVVSIGPVTSQELGKHGIAADLEPSHPKMGFLVREAADQGAELLQEKRSRGSAKSSH